MKYLPLDLSIVFLFFFGVTTTPFSPILFTQDAGSDADDPVTLAPKGYRPSPEPSETDEKTEPEKILEGLARGGGKGKKVLVLDVKGVVDLGLSSFIERQLEASRDFALVVLDIDTPGGRVDAALKIRDALLQSKTKTAAFIHPRAISAGALVAFACDTIAISTGGSFGAATPVALTGEGAKEVDEKMLSFFRAEMASTARAKGRRGDIAEAMVDKDIFIEGITEAGKLLTLDTDNALRLKVADLRADSLAELMEEIGLGGADIHHPKMGWAEKLARWLTHPLVSGLLMSIGVLAILIELYQPGFGAPGIVGICCLALFFFGHLVVHLAGWEELLLLGIGIILLLFEIFVSPGYAIMGIIGVALIITSLTMTLISLPLRLSFETGLLRQALVRIIVSSLSSIALFLLAIKILPRLRVAHPLVEKATISSRANEPITTPLGSPVAQVGQEGKAVSHLHPTGRALINSNIVEVIAEGSFIDEGTPVIVVQVEGNKIIVREKRDKPW